MRSHNVSAIAPNIVVAQDITPFRERKERTLNGAHTFSVPAAFLLGNQIVLDNLNHPLTLKFIERIIFDEIAPSLEVDRESAAAFAHQALDRWRNPFLQHKLIHITLHATAQMRAQRAGAFALLSKNQKHAAAHGLRFRGLSAVHARRGRTERQGFRPSRRSAVSHQ